MAELEITEIIAIFKDIAVPAFSIALVFGLGAKIVRSLLSMGMDGKFKI